MRKIISRFFWKITTDEVIIWLEINFRGGSRVRACAVIFAIFLGYCCLRKFFFYNVCEINICGQKDRKSWWISRAVVFGRLVCNRCVRWVLENFLIFSFIIIYYFCCYKFSFEKMFMDFWDQRWRDFRVQKWWTLENLDVSDFYRYQFARICLLIFSWYLIELFVQYNQF